MHTDTKKYNRAQAPSDRAICQLLAEQIDRKLPEAENRIWHAHPVWFLDGNPIVGYSKLKDCVRLLFWSGQIVLARWNASEVYQQVGGEWRILHAHWSFTLPRLAGPPG